MVYGGCIELLHKHQCGGTTLQTHCIPIISHDTLRIFHDFPLNIPVWSHDLELYWYILYGISINQPFLSVHLTVVFFNVLRLNGAQEGGAGASGAGAAGEAETLAPQEQDFRLLRHGGHSGDEKSREKWITGWWFGTFFIFPYIGNNHPNWLIFFRGVQTTNQFVRGVRKLYWIR